MPLSSALLVHEPCDETVRALKKHGGIIGRYDLGIAFLVMTIKTDAAMQMIDLRFGKVKGHGILFERPSNARADDIDHGRKRHNLVPGLERIRIAIFPKQRVTNVVIG